MRKVWTRPSSRSNVGLGGIALHQLGGGPARGPVAEVSRGAGHGRAVAIGRAAGGLGGGVGGAGVSQLALDRGQAVGRHQVGMGGNRTIRQVGGEGFAVAFLDEGDAHGRKNSWIM